MAMTLSEKLDSELHVVYVEPLPNPYAVPEYLTYHPEYRDEIRKIADREAHERLDREAEKTAELASSLGRLFGAKGLLVRAYPRLPEIDMPDRELDARMVDDEL
jgi:hypothetical protein